MRGGKVDAVSLKDFITIISASLSLYENQFNHFTKEEMGLPENPTLEDWERNFSEWQSDS